MVKNKLILVVGFATFFFGFGAPAILNLYLLSINSPLVLQFRSSLMFISSILGDGVILPIVNMVAVSFLLRHKELINRLRVIWALVFGVIITAYFHIVQAAHGLVNWAMPKPWQWNFLGIWHAIYMFLVASFICFFYLVLLSAFKKKIYLREVLIVTIGLIFFLILLKADYAVVDIKKNILP